MAKLTRYGAEGDDKTNHTEAIEHASAGGDGVLHFTSETYRITKPIEVNLAARGALTFTRDL